MKRLTRENLVVSVLPLEIHLRAGEEVLHVVFVLGHPLQHAEFHVVLALASDLVEVIEQDTSL